MNGNELVTKLPIIDEDVLTEASRQPLLFLEAARYRVVKMRKRSQATARYEAAKAQVSLLIRRSGEKKTEGEVKARIEKNKDLRTLQRELDESYEQEEFSKLLLEAYRQRHSILKILAEHKIYEGNRETFEIEKNEQHRKLVNSARRLQEHRHKRS